MSTRLAVYIKINCTKCQLTENDAPDITKIESVGKINRPQGCPDNRVKRQRVPVGNIKRAIQTLGLKARCL